MLRRAWLRPRAPPRARARPSPQQGGRPEGTRGGVEGETWAPSRRSQGSQSLTGPAKAAGLSVPTRWQQSIFFLQPRRGGRRGARWWEGGGNREPEPGQVARATPRAARGGVASRKLRAWALHWPQGGGLGSPRRWGGLSRLPPPPPLPPPTVMGAGDSTAHETTAAVLPLGREADF